MSWIMWFLAWFALVVLWMAFWRRYYQVDTGAHEIHLVPTGDGWRVALSRYRPSNPSHRYPVLLCHGLSANRFSFDIDEETSLARHLASRGYDVWVLELRGHGLSDHPRWFSGRKFGWSFDDYVLQDGPAAIDHILQQTGASRCIGWGTAWGGSFSTHNLPGGLPLRFALDYCGLWPRLLGLRE